MLECGDWEYDVNGTKKSTRDEKNMGGPMRRRSADVLNITSVATTVHRKGGETQGPPCVGSVGNALSRNGVAFIRIEENAKNHRGTVQHELAETLRRCEEDTRSKGKVWNN